MLGQTVHVSLVVIQQHAKHAPQQNKRQINQCVKNGSPPSGRKVKLFSRYSMDVNIGEIKSFL